MEGKLCLVPVTVGCEVVEVSGVICCQNGALAKLEEASGTAPFLVWEIKDCFELL